MPGVRQFPVGPLVVLVFAATALSGCTEPQSDDPWLTATLGGGERLYSWSDEDYLSPGEGSSRAINANFVAPLGLEQLGVIFSGHLQTDDSWITLRVRNADGGTLILVNASVGAQDETGEIRDLFRFEEVRALTSGDHTVRVEGQGSIGQLEFRIFGIDEDLDPVTRDFDSDGRDFTVRAFADGVGNAPTITVVDPDGGGTKLRFRHSSDDISRTIQGEAGTWNILFERSGWAGTVNVAIEPA